MFVFRNSEYLNSDVTNPLLTDDFMENTIYPESDSVLHNSMQLIAEFNGCGNEDYESLKDLISIIDLNNDGYDDIIVDSYCWGLNSYTSRIIFNDQGNYNKRLSVYGIVSNIASENGKVVGYYNTIPPCCTSPFWRVFYNEFIDDFKVEQKYTVEYCVNFRAQSIHSFISEQVTVKEDSVIIFSNPKHIENQSVVMDEICVPLKNRVVELIYKKGGYGIVILQNSKEVLGIMPDDNTYICGWIKLSDLK